MLSGSLNGLSAVYPIDNDFSKKYGKIDDVNNLEFDQDNVLCQSKLVLDGKSIEAWLTNKKFSWSVTYISPATRKQKTACHSINLRDVIVIEYEQGCDKTSNEIELFPSRYFSIHHARKAKSNKLKYQKVLFQTSDCETCKCYVDHIKQIISGFSHPKDLLVFINPVGGKKEAEKTYRTKVAPLFDIAKLRVTKVVTERMNHAKDYLQTEDISQYDGVISVGGDGMFSEVMNGILRYKDEKHEVLKSQAMKSIVLGIIPAGSTDTVMHCTTGCNDPTTAALQIILGNELPMDVCSVWHEKEFMKYSISLMAYGYFGDIIKDSENMRWIGPKRYDFAGLKRFMVNKSYEGEITFLGTTETETSDDVQQQCRQGCKRCSTFYDNTEDGTSPEDKWQTVRGRFISVLGANISCRCAKSSTGISPHSHIGDGHIDLVLVRKTTRVKHLHHLIKVSERTTEHFDFNFIEVHRVKEFRFKPIVRPPSTHLTVNGDGDSASNSSADSCCSSTSTGSSFDTSVWNVDGELVEHPELHFKVHRQLLRLYAKGIEV